MGNIRLTERDIAIFESLSTARFLTAEAIEWLHFPEWKERYRRWAQDTEPDKKPYAISGRLYGRLKAFREANPPLVYRIVRPVALSYSRFQRDDDVYALAPGGADFVAEAGRIAHDEIWTERLRTRSAQTLAHSAYIGTFYAALRERLERDGQHLYAWKGDHVLCKEYDSVSLTLHRNTSRKDGLWPVIPDAVFYLGEGAARRLYFLELDRGRPIRTWREKVRAYEAYRTYERKKLKDRYGVDDFTVVVATTTENQQTKLLQATADELKKVSQNYAFTLIERLHPSRIGPGWKRLATVERGPMRQVVDRLRDTWNITTETFRLIGA